jgi:hypothetical protein
MSLHWEIDVVHKAAATRQELSILHARQGLAKFYVTHSSDGVIGFGEEFRIGRRSTVTQVERSQVARSLDHLLTWREA